MLNQDFLREVNYRLKPRRITAIAPLANSSSLPDSTEKYIVQTTGGEFFVMLSSTVSPLMVKRAIERQREARLHLLEAAAEPIELPFVEGLFSGRSYGVWLRRQPLSGNRIRLRLEKLLLVPRVYRWLGDVISQTVTSADSSKLAVNLQKLQTIPALPTFIKATAGTASQGFLSGKIPAIQILQHGDVWLGNILKAPSKCGFIIIDWAGAKMDGAPFFDLVKFAISSGASKSKLGHEVAVHSRMLGCKVEDAPAYVLSGLAALHTELEYFPEDRFIDLCVKKMKALNTISIS